MKQFLIHFTARQKGAIGITSRYQRLVQAEDFEAARLKLYDWYEHVHVISAGEV